MSDSALPATAAGIAAEVRAGRLSPRAAVEASLERIARIDPELHAFVLVRAQPALEEADAVAARADLAELPLAGVPVAIKDNVAVAGHPTRAGSAATSDRPESHDHEVVRRLRAAGAVVVGKTTTPEFCVWGTTDSVYGVTRNPWDLTRTPGGSSGGSAAAVAAGMVPVALGNDGMGSIRNPAGCSGLVGVKPGFGVVPSGLGPTDWYGMAENGPLATTVQDAALFLSVLADRPELSQVREPDRPLRVAVSLKPPVAGVVVDREHARAVVRTATALEAAGHTIVRVDPPYPQSMALAGLARWFAGPLDDVETVDESLVSAPVRTHARIGLVTRRFIRPEQREAWRATLAGFFADHDVLITPTLARPPIEADPHRRRGWLSTILANARYGPFAAPWNVAGWPAAAVPAGVHPSVGTPLSVQLVAPEGQEPLLLGLAAQLERLRPWIRVAPRYASAELV
ncbi:MAG: amidase [Motilibacteraceae bacterium]